MALYQGTQKVAGNNGIPIIQLTKAQYDALSTAQRAGNIYMTIDEDMPLLIEVGINGNWHYKKYSDNTFEAFMVDEEVTPTLTMTQISTSAMYNSQTLMLTLPDIGITRVDHANIEPRTASYTYNINRNSSPTGSLNVYFQINKAGTSTAAVSYTARIYGMWA